MKSKVYVTIKGKRYDYSIMEYYMNDEIREQLHDMLAPCTEQEFMDAYMVADEEFNPNDYDYDHALCE